MRFTIVPGENRREWLDTDYTLALRESVKTTDMKVAMHELESACARSQDPAVVKAYERLLAAREVLKLLGERDE